MTILEQKVSELKEKLLAMAGRVEEMVGASIQALVKRDTTAAERVIQELEEQVNSSEIEIEDLAINLVALYQPEASNLRTITMVIKINNDLERIGDHAVNIAEAALFLIPRPPVKPLIDLPRMAEAAVNMLHDSLDAFTRSDAELARAVCARDSIVDSLKDQINRELITYMTSDASTIDRALKLMLISLNLERIADLATNISEDVIYAVKGEVIKHGKCESAG
ncbi:MAG: phosphate signaling complex protein PhoU [candidate division WOR-3 bacterium]|uniref:Phosphate-specific transport system accessory protein PhoU n=1 Tax=candidate division WOR-3 bacterium TaxID=2052148 RepID=A0A7C1WME2_UNCW3|nr:phosphate signaling complex protein PhoU [candidate division WOR-3 bacterium]